MSTSRKQSQNSEIYGRLPTFSPSLIFHSLSTELHRALGRLREGGVATEHWRTCDHSTHPGTRGSQAATVPEEGQGRGHDASAKS